MPPRARGYRAKQPCRTERKVPKHSLGPRARAGLCEGLLGTATAAAWDRKVQDRGGRPALRLSSLDQVAGPGVPGDGRALQPSRTTRCEEALRSCPAGRAGATLLWSQPRGPEAASLAFPSLARPSGSKSETARTNRSASAGPARTPLSLGSPLRSAARLPPLRRDLCGRRQAPGPWGLGH